MAEASKKAKPRRVQGEGGISRRPNGLYVGKVELPRDPITGKRRDRRVTGMVHSEVVMKLQRLQRELSDHGDLPTGSETVEKWMKFWMENINKTRPSTRAGYRSSIKYINAAIGPIRLSALTASDIRKVEMFIVRTKKLSPTTAHNAYQVLAKALKDAEREGRVIRNVARMTDPPRKAFTTLGVLTAEEGIAVLREVSDVKIDRLQSRWAMALLTGARQGEVLGLEIDRVDFDANEIDLSWQLQSIAWQHGLDCGVVGKYHTDTGIPRDLRACGRKQGSTCPTRFLDAPADWEHRHLTGGLYLSRPKSKAGWRVIPLVEPLRSFMRERIIESANEPNPYGLVWTAEAKKGRGGKTSSHAALPLDGMPVDPSHDNAAWHRILVRAGLHSVPLHAARHTAVTILYDMDVPETVIQDIVGQSTVSVTRAYRSKSKKPLIDAMNALGAALTEKLEIAP
jgi:integrase